MKILVLAPFGKCEPYGDENLMKVKRPDTEFSFECLYDVFPLPYNTYIYNTLKCINAAVERCIKAEKQGYDAVVLSCMLDPGLLEARAVVDIPVTATFESAAHLACMMAKRYSVVTTDPMTGSGIDMRLVDLYGVRQKLASIRWINITANQLYPEITPTEEIARRVVAVSKKCIEEDGAELIIPGCTIIGTLCTKLFQQDSMKAIGVPIIDPQIVAFKQAEMMVDLCKLAGYPAVSRYGLWRKQPQPEFEEFRKWMKEHPSPEQFYQK
ncbi:MAG TPA: aspartate/glutamate racemase family protein [Thermodesulfobacteriota bacterium]|nr:aspartate/glutamate racemase family protein [Thermodesulfobacteriota bacterium]